MNKPARTLAPLTLHCDSLYKGMPLGRVLMDKGLVTPRDMADALAQAAADGAALERVVQSGALVSPGDVAGALALRNGKFLLRRDRHPPDPELSGLLSAAFCLEHSVLPWMRLGDATLVATSRPDQIPALRSILEERLGKTVIAITSEQDVQDVIAERHCLELAELAETQVPADLSCRDINRMTPLRAAAFMLFGGLAVAAIVTFPRAFFLAVVVAAIVTLFASQTLKIATFVFGRKKPIRAPKTQTDIPARPTVSVLVPLFHESAIVADLVDRLSRLTYPKSLLDVILVLEQSDDTTRASLSDLALPPWVRVVEVPDGKIKTKPRALNYAMRFARGDIIGILDAEDAPASDQIDRIVEHFHNAGPEVACVQGILDFYNPQANWLSRCFTIEYATWFRVVLAGAARMGFAIPLGGTTVYLKRAALEHVHGWDAHNVTEDADLGVRLARYGYKTELINTVTKEEANNRLWPWVRQRSRWLKGYMITYLVHMRRPFRLLRQLGGWKFFGFQLFFLTGILQFTLAPALWSFWLVLFGLPHPFTDLLPAEYLGPLVALFLASEVVSLIIGFAAVARSQHDNLMIWVPAMLLYFPLGVFAAYKALNELLFAPYYWDKTRHGVSPPDTRGADIHTTMR